jgi:molybdopterin synthase catalytic subunit
VAAVHVSIVVQPDDFRIDAVYAAARARLGARAGAITAFVGLVRDRAGADAVTGLYLEHYPGMTERSLGVIIDQACSRWPLLDVVVIHRVGELAPVDQIVLVQVASAHRAAAFAACEYIMDYLKTDAVFWKRETGSMGARWVAATGEDRARVSAWATSVDG